MELKDHPNPGLFYLLGKVAGRLITIWAIAYVIGLLTK